MPVSFLIKLQALPAILLKKRLWHRCFPVNFVKSFKNTFFTEDLRALASGWKSVFKCKKVTNFELSLANKLEITIREFVYYCGSSLCDLFLCIFEETLYQNMLGLLLSR